MTRNAPRNTDNRPRLEFSAPRDLYKPTLKLNVSLLNDHKTKLLPDNLPPSLQERAYVSIIDPLLRMDQFDFAREAVRQLALLQTASDTGLYLAMASVTIHTTQYQSARDALNKSVTANQTADPYAVYREELHARLLGRIGNRPDAIRHYQRALELAPHQSRYLFNIANLYAFQQNWNEAIYWMRRYLKTDPYPLANYWETLGDYLLSGGLESEAISAFQKAIELNPYTYLARLRMAELYAQGGRDRQAIDYLEFLTVYSIDRNPEIYQLLAKLYLDRKDWDQAKRVLEKGRRIFPNNAEIYKLYVHIFEEDVHRVTDE